MSEAVQAMEEAEPVEAVTPNLDEAARGDSLIGVGCAFEGLLSFRGNARIDGELVGDVVGRGRLVLGPRARVKARIEVDELILGGHVEGEVRARTRVHLTATGCLDGALCTPGLALEDGGQLNGRCLTGAAAGAIARDGSKPLAEALSGPTSS